MDINRIDRLCNWLRNLGNRPNALNFPVSNSDVVKIHEEIVWIVKDIESGQPLFGNRLLEIKDRLFNEYIVNRNTSTSLH